MIEKLIPMLDEMEVTEQLLGLDNKIKSLKTGRIEVELSGCWKKPEKNEGRTTN